MKTQMLVVVALSAAALFTGCESLDTGAVANAGLAAASASKGGNKAGAAVAVGAAGVNAASAIAASRNESKPADGTAQPQQQTATPPSGAQSTATQTATTAQPVAATAQLQPAAATAQPKPQPPPPAKKPQYTVAQYRAAFAKRTPEQIADYILAVSNMKDAERQGFDFKTTLKALTPLNGFDVALVLEQKDKGWMRINLLQEIYPQLQALNTQAEIKAVFPKLSALTKIAEMKKGKRYMTYDHGADRELKDFDFYQVLLEKITDPTLAEYVLTLDPVLNTANLDVLVQKLSDAKKNKLYEAAVKRAEARKDRIVMEGYYVDMPVLDFKMLIWRNGFDKQVSIRGKMVHPIWYQINSYVALSKQVVVQLRFTNKMWMKFLDCEDANALHQFIHKYVKGKQGTAEQLAYLENIQLMEVPKELNYPDPEDYEGVQTYSNSRLETKVVYAPKRGEIVFFEF